jgi:hypothetical protein
MDKLKLTNKEQIEILEEVKKRLLLNSYDVWEGLCALIQRELIGRGYVKKYGLPYNDIKMYIPLFTHKNACEHANSKIDDDLGGYWWPCYSRYNKQDRIKFIEWMIDIYNSRN